MTKDFLKNILILGLVVVVIGGVVYTINKSKSTPTTVQSAETEKTAPVTSNTNQPPRQMIPILKKGDKFSDSSIFKMAFQIAPGDISDDARVALTGFNVDRTTNPDGSMTVKLTPTESTYQYQQYTVNPGQTLYFIEAAAADDNQSENKDLNLRDDYGVLVDASGIVL